MRGKYIIDVDTGVDDAQALMLALSRPEMDILAITCVAGNVEVDQVCINTLKVLAACNRTEVCLITSVTIHVLVYNTAVGELLCNGSLSRFRKCFDRCFMSFYFTCLSYVCVIANYAKLAPMICNTTQVLLSFSHNPAE